MNKIGRKSIVKVEEHKESDELDIPFNLNELSIIQHEFGSKIKVIFKANQQQAVKAEQYVGYVILPNHLIKIQSKLEGINFINMIKYSLGLLKIKEEDLPVAESRYFYDILISFLLRGVESIIKRGLYNYYIETNENLNVIRGKILFREHLSYNFDRSDKVFCSFSELTPDILENQIIKFTLFYLSRGDFIDDSINTRLFTLYKKLDNVELKPINRNVFNDINYTPLNEHYRPVINLCELLLRESSVDIENLGQKSSFSFLIDMDRLFQDFVGNFLRDKIGEKNVKLQKRE
jgi:5-methylcytosine-specific restriction enzyme subunit McrC